MKERILKYVVGFAASIMVLLLGMLIVPLLAEYHGLSQFWITNLLYEIMSMGVLLVLAMAEWLILSATFQKA